MSAITFPTKTKQTIIDQQKTALQARAFRLSSGISLRTIAKRMEISAAYLSDLELGRRLWSEEMCKRFRAAVEVREG